MNLPSPFRRTSLYNFIYKALIYPVNLLLIDLCVFSSFLAAVIFAHFPSLLYLIISLEWKRTKLWLWRPKPTRRV